MKCPSCDEVLHRIEYEGMPICTCPGCKGEFLDGKELKYIERKQELQFDRAERNRLLYGKKGPKKEKRLVCPRCGNHMSKGRYRKTEVIIDHCKSCMGVWLDDQELEKIQVLGEAGKTERPGHPGLAEAVVGARAVARKQPGESTTEQGYAPEISVREMSMSIPKLRVRMVIAGLFIAFLVVWASGLLHDLLPLDRIFGKAILEAADEFLPAALVLVAAFAAFSFRKITLRPDRGLEVTRYLFGIPHTREYSRKELKCIGTDFSRSFFSGGGISSMLIEAWLLGYYWAYWHIAQGSNISGTSYLYVVLKSGKRILIYRGRDENRVGTLADFLQSGLKLEVRRL